jgi:small subunit ribosomal protein S16
MLVIRLSRTGRKKQPYYRVVVAEKSAPIKGRFLEVIGHFNPRTKDLKIDADRAKARLKNGAQPSETAEALLEKAGVLKREAVSEKNRRPKRKPKKEMKAEAAKEGDKPADAPKSDATPPAKTDEAKPPAKAEDKAPAKPEDAAPKQPAAKAEQKPEEKPGPKEKGESDGK